MTYLSIYIYDEELTQVIMRLLSPMACHLQTGDPGQLAV